MTRTDPAAMIRLRLLSRPGCRLCDDLRRDVDSMLEEIPHVWEIVDVDSEPDLSARFGDSIPVLYVGGRLFARTRLPPIAPRLRLLRAVRKQRAER